MAAVRWILFDMRNRCWVSLGKAVIVNRLILRDFIMSFRLIKTIKEALRTGENEKCLIVERGTILLRIWEDNLFNF